MNVTRGNARAVTAALWLAVGMALAACGGGSGGGSGGAASPTGPGGSAAPTAWPLAVDPNPWAATVATDDTRSAAADMPLTGGTLTATGADGTVYTLTVPADALFEPTRITMTPLASVSGLPVIGPSAGVQLSPDGTQFFKPVLLRITLPPGASWPIDRQIPVSLEGTANVASLAPLDPTSTDPVFSLMHFSSYVVLLSEKGMGATLSQADVRNRFGGNEEQRMRSAAAEVLGRERMRQLLGMTDGEVAISMAGMLAEYEEKVVKPRIALAGSSCAAAKLAVQTVLGHERQKQLLGAGETSASNDSILAVIDVAMEVCMREEYQICRDEHIVTRMLPFLLSLSRQAALLGWDPAGTSPPPAGLAAAEEYTRKCLQFELQFDSSSTLSVADSRGFSMSENVTARAKFGYTAMITAIGTAPPDIMRTLGLISGPLVPLVARNYSVSYSDPCHTVNSSQAIGGEFGVSFLTLKADENTPQTPGGALRLTDVGVSMAISPNLSTYSLTTRSSSSTGCTNPSTTTAEIESWSTTVGSALLGGLVDPDHGAYATAWQMVNTEIVATKDIAINETDGGSGSITGSVRMVLFHTPLP